MEEKQKLLIKDIIALMPSKDLRESYEKDIESGNVPDLNTSQLFHMMMHLTNENDDDIRADFMKRILDVNTDFYVANKIKPYLNNYEATGKCFTRVISFVPSFINLKAIFKTGDLIKYKYKNKTFYGVVANYDFSTPEKNDAEYSYSYDVYRAYSVDCFLNNNDDDCSFGYFLCHKEVTESASIDELSKEQYETYKKIQKYIGDE